MAKKPTIKATSRKDGRMEKTLTINGKRRHFYGADENEILQKIAAYKENISSGPFFTEVAETWRSSYSEAVEFYTYDKTKAAYNRVKDYFDGIRIKQIMPQDINKFYNYMSSKGYAKKTVNNHRAILNNIFNFAIVEGYIDTNPAFFVAMPKKLKQTRRELPSDEDIKRVKNSIHCESGFLAYFLMYTGCRKGEALALQYKDIDLKNKVIKIYKSVYYEGNVAKIKQPKTVSGIREIPLLDKLIPYLPQGPKDQYIFSVDGNCPLSHSTFNRRWDKYQEQSGVSATPHQLRHAYATMLYESGIDEKLAQELMGHSDIATTRNIYTHIRTSKVKDAANILNSVDF